MRIPGFSATGSLYEQWFLNRHPVVQNLNSIPGPVILEQTSCNRLGQEHSIFENCKSWLRCSNDDPSLHLRISDMIQLRDD
jgi:hypothetical protein